MKNLTISKEALGDNGTIIALVTYGKQTPQYLKDEEKQFFQLFFVNQMANQTAK